MGKHNTIIDFIEGEVWKDLKECPDRYSISSKGRLVSKERHIDAISRNGNSYKLFIPSKLIKYRVENDYYKVPIFYNGKKYRRSIHRLVAEAFIPNPENKPTVNHKNTIKNDNRIENLEWNTIKENTQHAWNNNCCEARRGEKCKTAKLTNLQASLIRRFFRIYPQANQKNVAKKFNITTSSVCNIIQNKQYIDDAYIPNDRGINSKTLNKESVLKIREIGKSQQYSITASQFNTSKHIVYQIVNNISWKDLR